MKEVYAEVTRQCKLSHPAVEAEMMNNALQEVRNKPPDVKCTKKVS